MLVWESGGGVVAVSAYMGGTRGSHMHIHTRPKG